MELALLVYLVDLLSTLGKVFAATAIFGVTLTGGYAFIVYEEVDNYKDYCYWKTFILLGVISVLIPSEKTMQYMAGAYLVQSIYQSEFIDKATPLAEKAILNQLQAWAKDNPDVATLIENVPTITTK